MDLSIVTGLYNSAPYLEEFYDRVRKEAEKITSDYEILLVNDGSLDHSLEIAVSLFEKNDRVKVIDLSRNFGHHKAMMTGLSYAKGDFIFLIDCDLEEDPELLTPFYSKMKETHADVVYGVQQTRKGNWFERITGSLFYTLFNLLSSYKVPPNPLVARLMSKRYVKALVQHKDQEIFLAGLWAITGFDQVSMTVKKHSKGTSVYTFHKKAAMLVNAITSFSNKPLIYIFYLGCTIIFASAISASYLVIRRIFLQTYLSGWPSVIVSLWFLGGLTIFTIGIVGVYLSKIFTETKDRPYTVIRQIYERND